MSRERKPWLGVLGRIRLDPSTVTDASIEEQFKWIRSFRSPLVQRVLTLTSPVKVNLVVKEVGFGGNIPLTLECSVSLRMLGIPGLAVTFTVNGSAAGTGKTDKDGKASLNYFLSKPGEYVFKAAVGKNAFDEEKVVVWAVDVSSVIPVNFKANDQAFTAPVSILFLDYAGGPSYTISFPELVRRGAGDDWLLRSPATVRVTGSQTVAARYVKPIPKVVGPSAILDGQDTPVYVLLTTEKNEAVPYQDVTVEDNGKAVSTVRTDADGKGNVVLSLPEGSHKLRGSWMSNVGETFTVNVVRPVITIESPAPYNEDVALYTIDLGKDFAYTVKARTQAGSVVTWLPISILLNNQVLGNVQTDAYGNYSSTITPSREGSYTLEAWSYGKSMAKLNFYVEAKPVAAIVVSPGAVAAGELVTVSVIVTAADTKMPLQKSVVWLEKPIPGGYETVDLKYADAEGKAVLNVPSGINYRLVVMSPSFPDKVYVDYQAAVTPVAVLTEVSVFLTVSMQRVFIRLRDTLTNQPVAGAFVKMDFEGLIQYAGYTNENGVYDVSKVILATYIVTLSKAGYRTVSFSATVQQEPRGLTEVIAGMESL